MYKPFILIFAFLLAGCESLTSGLICTDIGCLDGLEILFSESVPVGATIAVETGGGVPLRIECLKEFDCGRSVFLQDFHPSAARVTVEIDGVETTRDLSPTYEEQRPNGDRCPPTCLYGQVTFQLEASS